MSSRKIGDDHVLSVTDLLKRLLAGETFSHVNDPSLETAKFILEKLPNISSVRSKFEFDHPDRHSDLSVQLKSGETININLYKVKGMAKIQPKNIGALSFLKKYFLTEDLQIQFNAFLEEEYLNFLRNIVSQNNKASSRLSKFELKKLVGLKFSEFKDDIEPYRQHFLYQLREQCYELLREEYNDDHTDGISHAFRKLLLIDSMNIITRYNIKNKCLRVEKFNFNLPIENNVTIYKKGRNSIGVAVGNISLLLRFKFESGPTSSIKLSTSYEEIITDARNIEEENKKDIQKFEQLIVEHKQIEYTNKSNAIGKCNEAIVYYQILKDHPAINQVDPDEYKKLFLKYSILVPTIIIHNLIDTAKIAATKLIEFLSKKYDSITIQSLQLVPDSYLDNRLDTSDIKVILMVNGKIVEEKFSLKAYANKVQKLTVKNPGVGTILGEQYFGIGSMENKVAEVKQSFLDKKLDHKQCLIEISHEIGEKLSRADQKALMKGIRNLLGEFALILSFYSKGDSVILEYGNVNSEVTVLQNEPSPIQTTLTWNNRNEELALRVKFSSSQKKGWSSLKLSCEMKLNC